MRAVDRVHPQLQLQQADLTQRRVEREVRALVQAVRDRVHRQVAVGNAHRALDQ